MSRWRGCEQSVAGHRVLDRGRGPPYSVAVERIRRLVFIVSPRRRQLYESLTRTFAGDSTVSVILDRRDRERRQRAGTPAAERREKDRRRKTEVQKKLSQRGYTVVGVVAPKPSARRS